MEKKLKTRKFLNSN